MPSLELFPVPPPLSSQYVLYPIRCSAQQAGQVGALLTLPTPTRTQAWQVRIAVPGYLAFGCPRSPAHLAGMDAFRNESKASTLDLRHHSVHLAARPCSRISHQPTPQLSLDCRIAQPLLSPAPDLSGDCELMGSPPCRPTQA